MEGSAAADRIFEILSPPRGATGLQDPEPLPPTRISIEISGVGYVSGKRGRAPDLARPAGGKRDRSSGAAGAGKSTLVNLLMRFVDPDEGTIRANGVEITDLPAESWRRTSRWCPRGRTSSTGACSRTSAWHVPPRAGGDRKRRRARRQNSSGHSPMATDQGRGAWGDDEWGEASRIAIARAFLKDAPVLIMDEPTSGLDPEASV